MGRRGGDVPYMTARRRSRSSANLAAGAARYNVAKLMEQYGDTKLHTEKRRSREKIT
jgi:hypothetical protein